MTKGGGKPMSLTADQVRWVAHLARLELSDAELETMTRQLSGIVDYVNQLQAVNTDGVEPLAHALEVHNVFREDEPRPHAREAHTVSREGEPRPSLPVDEALANAPDRRGDFYGVPAVLE